MLFYSLTWNSASKYLETAFFALASDDVLFSKIRRKRSYLTRWGRWGRGDGDALLEIDGRLWGTVVPLADWTLALSLTSESLAVALTNSQP